MAVLQLGAQRRARTTRAGAGGSRAARYFSSTEARTLVGLVLATNLGFFIRLFHVALGQGFPLNDGGMFYVMADEVRQANYTLPWFTAYNGAEIPFAYPPLGFYVAALIADAGGVPLLEVFRFLPLALSVLCVPAFFLLAKSLLPSPRMVIVATLLFALAPRAFNWEIMGGGVTRSLGLLFALLALAAAVRLYRRPSLAGAALLAVPASLAVLSHPEMGWFLAFSIALLLAANGRSPRAVLYSALAGASVLVLTAPWWLTVLLRHGAEPILSASETSRLSPFAPLYFLLFDFTNEPLFPILAALGLIGLVSCLGERRYLLPAWLLLIFALDPRKAATLATIPLAMLSAHAIYGVLLPVLSKRLQPDEGRRPAAAAWRLEGALVVVTVAYALLSALVAVGEPDSPLTVLSRGERDAMAWARQETPPESRFLVVSGREQAAWTDARAEWFPALAQRRSVATVQGSEWLGTMTEARELSTDLQACADRTESCLGELAAAYGLGFTHVYVPQVREGRLAARERDCCALLRQSLLDSEAYRLVYDGTDAQIFAVAPPADAVVPREQESKQTMKAMVDR